ncbi:cell division protein FtsL [Castellaniella sp. UC4442_H9]|jgi:cell division protein FtsL
MTRLAMLLTLALMTSAISLVTVRFQTRELFVASERLKSQSHELDVDWRRLQLDRAELARNARIDALARTELHLVPVTQGRTIYLQESAAPAHPDASGGRP